MYSIDYGVIIIIISVSVEVCWVTVHSLGHFSYKELYLYVRNFKRGWLNAILNLVMEEIDFSCIMKLICYSKEDQLKTKCIETN